MNSTFYNMNNNDTTHDIIFLHLVSFASGAEKISVLFDGIEYSAPVFFDSNSNRSFRRCGKVYDFEIN